MEKIAVITGGSSGIGRSCCQEFLNKGYVVYELSRSGRTIGKINHITADVTDEESLKNAFLSIYEKEKHIHVVVVNSGIGISGAIEYTNLEDAKKIFDVNFFGCFLTVKTAIPYLRKENNPKIIAVSSVAGKIAIPFQSFYSATKAGVNSLMYALSNEVKPFGIKISVVMPGDVKTNFTSAREKNEEGDGIYSSKIKKSVASMEKDEQNGLSPLIVAKTIYKVANKRHPHVFYVVGGKYKFFVFLLKLLPDTFINFLVGKLY